MLADSQVDVTTLLLEIQAGSERSRHRLVERIYAELHQAAEALMRNERPDHTLQPTALVHEALARLLEGDLFDRAPNRQYLFGAAARAMREVLVDFARHRRRLKRGGNGRPVPLDAVLAFFEEQNLDVLALHESLDRLARLDPRQSDVVTLRFFGGFTMPEIAEQLGVSLSTVETDFRIARAWLRRELQTVD